MFKRRRKRRTDFPRPRRRVTPAGWLIVLIMFVVALIGWGRSRPFLYWWLEARLPNSAEAGPVVAICALMVGLIVFAFNFRRPIAWSRRKGGNGLRLGQGPLPDRTAFDSRIERLAGTLYGKMMALGYWLLITVTTVVLGAVVPLLLFLLIVTFGLALLVWLAPWLGWPAFFFFFPGLPLMSYGLMRYKPRAFATLHLVDRIQTRWAYAVERLSRRAPRPETGHEPAPPDPGPADLSPEAMDERWRKARRFGDF